MGYIFFLFDWSDLSFIDFSVANNFPLSFLALLTQGLLSKFVSPLEIPDYSWLKSVFREWLRKSIDVWIFFFFSSKERRTYIPWGKNKVLFCWDMLHEAWIIFIFYSALYCHYISVIPLSSTSLYILSNCKSIIKNFSYEFNQTLETESLWRIFFFLRGNGRSFHYLLNDLKTI